MMKHKQKILGKMSMGLQPNTMRKLANYCSLRLQFNLLKTIFSKILRIRNKYKTSTPLNVRAILVHVATKNVS